MTRRRLTIWLLLFFLALAIPTSILVYQAYGQLKWEAFHQHQQLARELSLRIDAGFREIIEREENRSISDYEFLNVAGSDGAAFLQRSPLSQFPLDSELPGLLGYFQVDASGQLHTPIVPGENASSYGISSSELRQREQQAGRIRGILDQNRLTGKSKIAAAPAAAAMEEELQVESLDLASELDSLSSGQSSDAREDSDSSGGQSFFDELTSRKLSSPTESKMPSSQVKDLKLEDSYEVAAAAESEPKRRAKKKNAEKSSRKEQVNLPQALMKQDDSLGASAAKSVINEVADEPLLSQQEIRIETFESEVEAMEFAQLDSGHFVLFRRVWHKNERYVQGILIDRKTFIEQLIAPAFRQSSLSSMSRLIVAYQGGILQNFSPEYSRLYQPGTEQVSNELLYQSRLIAPFGDIELIYTLARLPVGAGGKIIIWSALVLAIVLVGGCFMLFRLGLRQLALAHQQQDFVSAVSHELKTPLTSIRMYGEMLREGWVDEAKRKTYYDFIFHESERLTRLINNVLQLARMSRNEQVVSLSEVSVEQAIAILKPRLESQLEPSKFELSVQGDEDMTNAVIKIDSDWFLQIFINLVDNALKFSSNAELKRIDLGYQIMRDGAIVFSVRDYGPGIAADQMKKIFQLFYRSENELTRETVGTGIGLALVQQLASAMHAEVDLVNCEPGVEFRIRFPVDRKK
jgi:signal transduction histidine kinase